MAPSSNILTRHILFGLWANWVLAVGSVAATLALSLIVPPAWLPLSMVVMAWLLMADVRREARRPGPGCVLTLRVALLTLFWSAVVMGAISVLTTSTLLDGIIDRSTHNTDIPYITSLVVFPMLAVNCIWQICRGYGTRFCTDCRARSGFYPGGGVVATIYSRESRYQVMMMLYISFTLTVIQCWYYFSYYINISFNAPDRFFFAYMPLAVLILTIFFMWMRLGNLADIIGPMAVGEREQATVVRYIVVSGDRMLLQTLGLGRYDTPARAEIVAADGTVTEEMARDEMTRLMGGSTFTLRYLYTSKSHDLVTDVVHYAAFIPDGDDGRPGPTGWLRGEWMSLDDIDRLLHSAGLAAELADEIYRIYTITMAWKTYDRNARRLYPIRNYRPTFRLRDFRRWDVDYSDLTWFDIAGNNEDRPFWRLRRFWRRLTGLTKQSPA